ncbi:hypothetical protein [Pseudofrankia sp. DC12]|uniref:hypothetical protein n=1 Tax=Pseudofrankia sp. DC12 TaxID=683315 RepID=UPI000A7F6432|nr:hypothetical protein [Pseudofrankia sp. DC12]
MKAAVTDTRPATRIDKVRAVTVAAPRVTWIEVPVLAESGPARRAAAGVFA